MAQQLADFQKYYVRSLRHAGYDILGEHKHAAYKPCEYWKLALTKRIFCYKFWFYGIPTHRCIQWSPIIDCNQMCLFCWRPQPADFGLPPVQEVREVYDNPEELLDLAVEAFRKRLKGFHPRYRKKTDPVVWEDAWRKGPGHLATSLIGEPLLYPFIDDIMRLAKKKYGMTTFIVSNGTRPDVLERMHTLPDQLYISMVGGDFKTWAIATRPLINAREQWKAFLGTLELIPSLNTRVVIRITAVKYLNMKNIENYARLISLAQPDFVEVKGFSYIGGAKAKSRGLSRKNVPTMEDIRSFAYALAELIGYEVCDEIKRARIVLLWNGKTPFELRPRNEYPYARR